MMLCPRTSQEAAGEPMSRGDVALVFSMRLRGAPPAPSDAVWAGPAIVTITPMFSMSPLFTRLLCWYVRLRVGRDVLRSGGACCRNHSDRFLRRFGIRRLLPGLKHEGGRQFLIFCARTRRALTRRLRLLGSVLSFRPGISEQFTNPQLGFVQL